MKAKKSAQSSITATVGQIPPSGAIKKQTQERNSIQYLKTQAYALAPDSYKAHSSAANKISTKTNTAFGAR